MEGDTIKNISLNKLVVRCIEYALSDLEDKEEARNRILYEWI